MIFPTLVRFGVYCLVWLGAYVLWKAHGWALEALQAGLIAVVGILAGELAYHVAVGECEAQRARDEARRRPPR